MSYSADILDKRLTILSPAAGTTGDYGVVFSSYQPSDDDIYAGLTFSRGARAMREGALDAYEVVMIRTRYHAALTRQCRLMDADGHVYAIDSFHAEQRQNTIQITATELQDQLPVVPCYRGSFINLDISGWTAGSSLTVKAKVGAVTTTITVAYSSAATLSAIVSYINAQSTPLKALLCAGGDAIALYNPAGLVVSGPVTVTPTGCTATATLVLRMFKDSSWATEVRLSPFFRYYASSTFYRYHPATDTFAEE